MLGAAVVVGGVISGLASTAHLRMTKLQCSLFLLCMVFAAWLSIERGALRQLLAVPRALFHAGSGFWLYILKVTLIVWLGLGAYANFDMQSLRSSILFAVLLNVLTGAFLESSRSIRRVG